MLIEIAAPLLIIIWALLLAPAPLTLYAWTRKGSRGLILAALTLSDGLLLASVVRSAKAILIGPDYSTRLYCTIFLNGGIALLLLVFAAFKRQVMPAVIATLLMFDWWFMAVANTAV